MSQKLFLWLTVGLLSGFVFIPVLKADSDPQATAVCLTNCKEIPSIIEKYMLTHDIITEEDEIDFLFYRIRSSQIRFIRNGEEFDGAAAAQFLRWKMERYQQKHDDPIKTDEDFVVKILSGSKMSGKPYEVVMQDGQKFNLQRIMFNELNCLELFQGETPELPFLPN